MPGRKKKTHTAETFMKDIAKFIDKHPYYKAHGQPIMGGEEDYLLMTTQDKEYGTKYTGAKVEVTLIR